MSWWLTLPTQWATYKGTRDTVYQNKKAAGATEAEAQKESKRIALEMVNVTGAKPTLWERVRFWSPILIIAYAIYKVVKR